MEESNFRRNRRQAELQSRGWLDKDGSISFGVPLQIQMQHDFTPYESGDEYAVR
jgi:hypothetical protein